MTNSVAICAPLVRAFKCIFVARNVVRRKINDTIKKVSLSAPNIDLNTVTHLTQQILFAVGETEKVFKNFLTGLSERDKALKDINKWQTQCNNLNDQLSEYKRIEASNLKRMMDTMNVDLTNLHQDLHNLEKN